MVWNADGNEWNIEHLARHGVSAEEAEVVVRHPRPPYPLHRPDDKWLVWGRGRGGQLPQVVFVIDEDDSVYVIRARRLTEREKRRYRRKSEK